MIAFIDTEVNPQTRKVADYGVVREDGAVLHTHSKSDFDAFVSGCDAVCGHNIIDHDLKYTALRGNPVIIDTLPLSPLLFPKRPYHHLVKDDKLQVDELNNPVNDSMKARDLLNDEIAAWNQLSDDRKEIYYQLLHKTDHFGGFFKYIGYSSPTKQSFLNRILRSQPEWVQLILKEFEGRVCSHADFDTLVRQYPMELAYCLAVIGADDVFSITPAWVIRNYPQVVNVMNLLCNTSCDDCEYCHRQLDAHSGLREFFGYNEFRTFDGVPMQLQAVESAIRGESLLTIFPTGGGKSLTFQLPALMAGRNTHGLTVVISPLQSLMKDQVDNLVARSISEAVSINGLLDPIERATAIQQVADGTANLLYIAPEMLRSKTIERLLLGRNVVRFVIDEAHCFSAWGHDFRVDYLYIGDFIRELQNKKHLSKPIAISCFTATAKQKVISDICDYFRTKLGLELKVFAANAERKNLRYSVLHADTAEEKYNLLRSLILGHNCPTIVYVSRTRRTRELAEHLVRDGIRALPFNGKMESADKVKNQNAFMSGEVQVIVATSAFGMGVDKKDVGLVVHYNISDSLENYVQEAGRAGRDPEMQAECFVLYADSDLDKHFILLNQTKLSISEIQQVWKAIKDLTAKRDKVSCSPLDIARQAGWGDDVEDMETRIKAAIAALEDAGFIQRGSNSPHIFATGIAVKNMDEARRKLTISPLFDEQSREEAARIIKSLISSRATAEGRGAEAESRVDYLADILGLSKATVIRNINLMRQDGLLADSRDMQAWVTKSTSLRNLDIILKLEQFILQRLTEESLIINYKELNEEAQKAGLGYSTVKRFVQLIPGRLKHTTIQSATGVPGKVMTLKSLLDAEIKVDGTTAILTRTNEETMQVAYELERRGLHATVAQSMGGFRFGNLAEVRYFLKQIGKGSDIVISKDKWQAAKQRTLETYASSSCLNAMRRFFSDFEVTHQAYYHSDLLEYIFESDIEDFIAADEGLRADELSATRLSTDGVQEGSGMRSVFVSTIHKAKGREFNTVYLLSPVPDGRDINDMRAYYVGLTRAKQNLFLVTNPSADYSYLSIPLNMHDVWLDFFKGRKDIILRLRSGDSLKYKDGYLLNEQDINIAVLSATGKDKVKAWTDKGYGVISAKVSYTLAWKPQDSKLEYAVCLANIVLTKADESCNSRHK